MERCAARATTTPTCCWSASAAASAASRTLRDGEVLNGPATQPQPTFAVREQNGRIEVKEP